MSQTSLNTVTYRRGRFIRLINYQIWFLCLAMVIGFVSAAITIVILSPKYPFYLFAVILCLLAIYMLLYSRVSYFMAHGNKLIISSEGIGYEYLGIRGFAKWSDMLYFDEDTERAWLNIAYQTSDIRFMRLTILFFTWQIPLRNKSVIGICLDHEPKLGLSFFAKIPRANLDFIPLSLLVDIPRLKDGSGDINEFIKTELGQRLLHYAPHLFE